MGNQWVIPLILATSPLSVYLFPEVFPRPRLGRPGGGGGGHGGTRRRRLKAEFRPHRRQGRGGWQLRRGRRREGWGGRGHQTKLRLREFSVEEGAKCRLALLEHVGDDVSAVVDLGGDLGRPPQVSPQLVRRLQLFSHVKKELRKFPEGGLPGGDRTK